MNLQKMYIISWFGDGPTVEKRIKMHDNQLSWCFKNNLEPIVLAQNYKDEYYRPNVSYIKHYGEVLRFGEARDILLKQYYNSDEDFAIFADNDTYLYTGEKYGLNDHIIEIMKTTDIEQFDNVDLFYPLNPAFVPFSKDLEKNIVSDRYSLRMKPGYVAAQMFFLKNLKKHYDKEIYYDPNFVLPDRSILPAEDQEFPINLIHNGFSSFLCKNLIKKDEGLHNNSTWSTEEEEKWRQRCLQGLNYIAEKYRLPIKIKQQQSQEWIKIMQQRNHKLHDCHVFYKKTMFDELFIFE